MVCVTPQSFNKVSLIQFAKDCLKWMAGWAYTQRERERESKKEDTDTDKVTK
jgi:hypothetical protein